MKTIYTRHAEDKLKRKDIISFGVTKEVMEEILAKPRTKTKTKYGNWAAVKELDRQHDLRVVYDIMGIERKVITFHIAKKGRY